MLNHTMVFLEYIPIGRGYIKQGEKGWGWFGRPYNVILLVELVVRGTRFFGGVPLSLNAKSSFGSVSWFDF